MRNNYLGMKNITCLFLGFALLSFCSSANAEEVKVRKSGKTENTIKSNSANCAPGASYKYLQVNNVSCRINTGGDMWWDFENPQYEIPAGSSKTSMFSGSLWIGGVDVNNMLKVAAVRYRQGPTFNGGNDYWPGPLYNRENQAEGIVLAEIEPSVCLKYDKLFFMSQDMVNEFIANCDPETGIYDPTINEDYNIPEEILNWPAHPDMNDPRSQYQSYYLAPFYDNNNDGHYDPYMGDYPYYDLSNVLCSSNYAGDPTFVPATTMEGNGIQVDQCIKGDETLWWVFNDKGNIHTESFGDATGFEIRAQCFGFASNDEINNMTFYSYEIINRSSYELRDTYFSQWVDTDLGYGWDDYVGCDVLRGLGYCYNGNDVDGSGQYNAYGAQPPAIGVDFFQGPYLDPDGFDNPAFYGDGLLGPAYNSKNTPNEQLDCSIVAQNGQMISFTYGDGPKTGSKTGRFLVRSEAINGVNFGNGIVDDERYGMRRFVYHNNGGADYMSDPDVAANYYNLLKGIWKDNTKMRYGGNGHVSSGAEDIEADFMFPGDSDPCWWGTKGIIPANPMWTEETAGNTPNDRRFMQSAGPFNLRPGAVNYITVGIPWARATSGGPGIDGSVKLLRTVDDKCQALFDNCFAVVNGPNAPDLTILEMENELVFYISNRETNDSGNNFGESYQEVDPYIESIGYSRDSSTYKFEGYIVYQLVDAEASIADVGDQSKVRQIFQCDIKNGVSKIVNYEYDSDLDANVPTMKVNGTNEGISHTFKITTDAFTNTPLVNHKSYYFTAIAYGYNMYKRYSDQQAQWGDNCGIDGQTEPFLSGRKNIMTYEAIPHKPMGGVVVNSTYGDQPAIKRIQGHGNGGLVLHMDDATVDAILAKEPIKYRTDENGFLYTQDTLINKETYPAVIIPETHIGDPEYPIAYEVQYEKNYSPLNIKVVDPLNVVNTEYVLSFDSMYHATKQNVSNTGTVGVADTAGMMVSRWTLHDVVNGYTYKSDTSLVFKYEQLFLDLGLSITLEQTFFTKQYVVGYFQGDDAPEAEKHILVGESSNGLLYSGIHYADSTKKWLTGVQDMDEAGAYNWIRSGESADNAAPENNDWNLSIGGNGTPTGDAWDPMSAYEGILNGTWAPYSLTSYASQHDVAPAYNSTSKSMSTMESLYSVDVVFTSDKSKWTRCPVIEMCSDPSLSEGNQEKFGVRKAWSVDKDGNTISEADKQKYLSGNYTPNYDDPSRADYISPTGMGWFPGYAINIETGERLNMMFGEDSWLVGENGRDMKWNPTPNTVLGMYQPVSAYADPPTSAILFGGKHYIYVMGSRNAIFGGTPNPSFDCMAYDAGLFIHDALTRTDLPNALLNHKRNCVYANAMYVSIPLINPRYYDAQQSYLDNEATVSIRINRPYERYFNCVPLTENSAENNSYYPMYSFTTDGLAAETQVEEQLISELDDINVVPNPYYGLGQYDANQLENNIRIVNLPEECTIKIFNVGGQLIRSFNKASNEPYQQWDLKNENNIPIASGVYIIHISVPGVGEKTLKWLGLVRPTDLNTF